MISCGLDVLDEISADRDSRFIRKPEVAKIVYYWFSNNSLTF